MHSIFPRARVQAGATLLEALVAILLLSIGVVSLGATLSFAVQMPKLSGYRSAAVNLASSYIERMRANPEGFASGGYDQDSSYDGLRTAPAIATSDHCAYPNCTMTSLASMDFADLKVAARAELPAGGAYMVRDSQAGLPSGSDGNLWLVWQEPSSFARVNPFASDNCPPQITGHLADPRPRCLVVRFSL
jgi:type IV pilus assembly protein PilV